MFGAYLQGFIGLCIVIVSFFVMVIGFFKQDGLFFIGLMMFFAGGYLRYLSSQTTRIGDDLTAVGTGGSKIALAVKGNEGFVGLKDVLDADYRLFLVDKYSITKNDVLQISSFDRKSFNSLDEAINAAHKFEESQIK